MEKVSFRFKISPLVWALIVIVVGLLVTGIILNVQNLIEFWGYDTLDTVTYVLTSIMDLALLVATVMFIINSKYVITKNYVKFLMWGNPKKIPLDKITELTLYKLSNKLVLRYNVSDYTVVMIDVKNYQRFIDVLRSFNNQIFYLENTEENKN
ncbi:MAG: hypothetical protein J6R83_03220 [Clostridia bacterium]|nr:hypothetical protein [Clostridia bacterium]